MSRTSWLLVSGVTLIVVCLTLGLAVPLVSTSYEPTVMVLVWIPSLLAAGVIGTAGRFVLVAVLRERRSTATGALLRQARTLTLVGAGITALILAIAIGMGTGVASIVLLVWSLAAGVAVSASLNRAAVS
ncbi:hypothetical protein [Actinoplanes subglobosus]|uniref:Uncharacterized protein n=1 Tax=Actinoplanes subglobosus TaxID=1547892 RepID=A0ABV8IMQ4_9ACTN